MRILIHPAWIIAFLVMACSPKETKVELEELPELPVRKLAYTVKTGENREFSYTDKWSGYYYARTHSQRNQDWFSGWNVSTERIFQDYQLKANGNLLQREKASVTVYPNELTRDYPEGTETFRMFDHQRVLQVKFNSEENINSLSLVLHGERLQNPEVSGSMVFYQIKDLDKTLAIATIQPVKVRLSEPLQLEADVQAGGFYFALDSTREAASQLIQNARINSENWALERLLRMNQLVSEFNNLETGNPRIAKAVLWNILTVDQLITKQTGYGIYAGLPWFNDYWGRDMFISLPGACLVTGQFEIARKILKSFAEYQNTEEDSKNYGRVPNRLRPENIIYNTTDGTPRWVMALHDYINYTGDWSLIEEVYPAVQRSIEGPLRYWVDQKGYLAHDDADTWMDAKIENTIPWSPRGTRAVDIQALWYQQLMAGVKFAEKTGNAADAEKWRSVAEKMLANFRSDFIKKGEKGLADRLTATGKADFTLRPNQLFALDLVEDEVTRWEAIREVWSKLTFSWGVASLDPAHEEFHPLHENPEYYHKDAAYHNGTIWLWNNGVVMQRMIEADKQNEAWKLFTGMIAQTLDSGSVGGLAENTDAFPKNGAEAGKLSGTFLQAWSNAEFLRVWNQDFLGVKPQIDNKTLYLEPAMPDTVKQVSFSSTIGKGRLRGTFSRRNQYWESWVYTFNNLEVEVFVKIGLLKPVSVKPATGDQLWISIKGEKASYEMKDSSGNVKENGTLELDTEQLKGVEQREKIFEGISMATPGEIGLQKAVQSQNWLDQRRRKEWKGKK